MYLGSCKSFKSVNLCFIIFSTGFLLDDLFLRLLLLTLFCDLSLVVPSSSSWNMQPPPCMQTMRNHTQVYPTFTTINKIWSLMTRNWNKLYLLVNIFSFTKPDVVLLFVFHKFRSHS